MPSEYGYGGDGSVLGGIGQIIQLKDQQDKLDQQKAALPFLNHVLSQYTQGQQIPNLEALSSFVNSREGLARAGFSDAQSGHENEQTHEMQGLYPGEQTLQHQRIQSGQTANDWQVPNLQAQNAQDWARTDASNAESDQRRAETTNTVLQGSEIVPEANARIGQMNTDTDYTKGKSDLLIPEFDLSKAKLMFDMNDPNNEGALNTAKTKNLNAETNMYTNLGGTPNSGVVPGSGIDPKTRQAVLDALSGGGGQQTKQPQSLGDMFQHLTGQLQTDPDTGITMNNYGEVQQTPQQQQQQSAQSQVTQRVQSLAGLQDQLQKIKTALHDPKTDPNHLQTLQNMYEVITQRLGKQ